MKTKKNITQEYYLLSEIENEITKKGIKKMNGCESAYYGHILGAKYTIHWILENTKISLSESIKEDKKKDERRKTKHKIKTS
jgi:hypothetical protein